MKANEISVKKLQKLVSILFTITKTSLPEDLVTEVTCLQAENETLKSALKEKLEAKSAPVPAPVVAKVKRRGGGLLGRLFVKIVFLVVICLLIASAISNFFTEMQIKQLQADVEKKTAELLGKATDPTKDDWSTVLKRAQNWEEKYEEEHGKWRVDQEGWEEEREQWLAESTEKNGSLTTLALDVERLTAELERAKEGTDKWLQESEESRDLMYEARRTETRVRAEIVRVAANAWLLYKIAAYYKSKGFESFDLEERRDHFASGINELLNVICDQITKDSTAEKSPNFWKETRKNDGKELCKDVLKKVLVALGQNQFPFSKGLEGRLKDADLMD